MSSPILSLAPIERPDVERPVIEIDGRAYAMAVPSDLGYIERTITNAARKRFLRLERTEAILDEPDAAAKLKVALDQSVRVIVPGIPDDVLGRLDDDQKIQIMLAFSRPVTEVTAAPDPAANETPTTPKRTSSKRRSRASSDSTAGAPPNG